MTALAAFGPLLFATEGPLIRCYRSEDPENFRYVGSKRIFKSHAIHGIAVHQVDLRPVILAIWGGPLVCFLQLDHDALSSDIGASAWGHSRVSSVLTAPDWILDLSFQLTASLGLTERDAIKCAAVTAHNALIELTVQRSTQDEEVNSRLAPRLTESTSSSRSILYSAHLIWDSGDHVLVAAGTAFGEIIFWSWTKDPIKSSYSCVHRVFLGHEGSIFGVRISEEIKDASGNAQRYLASCSDDRTIRIWDLSDIQTRTAPGGVDAAISEVERTRHTGFSSETFDADVTNSPCLAMGWGHLSRVWAVEFVKSHCSSDSICLLSSGEDATSRAWQFSPRQSSSLGTDTTPIKLIQVGTAAYHSGKNIWSSIIFGAKGSQQVVCGAADSKITAYPLPTFEIVDGKPTDDITEYTLQDIVSMGQADSLAPETSVGLSRKRTKAEDFIRAYAFLDSASFLLTTNTGRVFMETVTSGAGAISKSELIHQLDEGCGHSVCVAEPSLGVAVVAGARGGIYMYQKSEPLKLQKIHTVQGKVGDLFIGRTSTNGTIVLLVTLMGRTFAQLLYVSTLQAEGPPSVTRITEVLLPEAVTGTTITSMAYIPIVANPACLFLGFRGGSVAGYLLPHPSDSNDQATAFVVRKFHGKEAVTSLLWYPASVCSSSPSPEGYLISVGRDGCCAIHHVVISPTTSPSSIQAQEIHLTITHHLPLPFGPTLEGLHLDQTTNNLLIYGFSSTKFILYNLTTEEEIASVETGGAHRSWAFHPSARGGGTLVWTRASTMHIRDFQQRGACHTVIRTGGHGREIKAVAVSPAHGLIATGAEDTDIKLFSYSSSGGHGKEKDLHALRTLRKHKTGIQCLQWSDDGAYLFSSGGAEEFFVWRVRQLPGWVGWGVVCEAEVARESLDVEVRCLGFDVRQEEDSRFVAALVFSDSTVRVHTDTPFTRSFSTLLRTTYATSCLTQTAFLSPTTLLTAGTDGYAVLWPLHLATQTPSKYHTPLRLHQNSSKTLVSQAIPGTQATLLVSGGDDGSIALCVATPSAPSTSPSSASPVPSGDVTLHPPTLVPRAHASAVTAVAIIPSNPNPNASSTHPRDHSFHILSSGTDQWLRLWAINITLAVADGVNGGGRGRGSLGIEIHVARAGKLKTSVADVSSMAVLDSVSFGAEGGEGVGEGGSRGKGARVVVCGVGMEVVRIGC